MKKKGFGFKRAVSLLLAAVMIVTAAPQTSLTALAAEQGMTIETPDVSEGLDIMTTEDGKTSKPEDAAGQDGTDADGDIGDESADVPSDDGSGVGSDEQAGGSDNADQSDNAGDHTDDPDGINQGDDAGDSDETADPEEGTNNNQTTDDESVSGNDLEGGMSVFGGELDEGPGYSKIIDNETTDEGKPYRRLVIDVSTAEEEGVTVVYDILLGYYAKQIELGKCAEFNCVEFQIADGSYSMKADYINGAIAVMDMENEEIGCWIDYNFWNDDDSAGVSYTLSHPRESETEAELDATCKVTLVPNQGVKINVKTTEFPAESVSVSYNVDVQDAFAECWDNAEQEDLYLDLRLLALDDDVTPNVIEQNGIWVGEYSFKDEDGNTVSGCNFGMDIKGMQAGKDYLITPLYTDEDVVKGSTRELTAGQRSGSSDGVSNVTWKSLDEELITIESGTGATATLTAADEMGEAYYYVTYTCDSKEWLELHSIRVAYVASDGTLKYIGEVVENCHEDENGKPTGDAYLRLRIDEAEAAEKNDSKDITPILKFYKDNGLQVNCVELSIVDESSGTSSTISPGMVKKDYINGARSVMGANSVDTEGEHGFWIDYNFRNEQTDTGVELTLDSPAEAGGDVSVAFTLSELPNQGLKVKFDSTAFPAERVSMNYNLSDKKYADSLKKDTGFRLFTHSSGTPKAMVDTNEEQGFGYYNTGGEGSDTWTSVHFNNIKLLGTTEYLATSIYEDEDRPIVGGDPVQLKAGTRADVSASSATSVTWMSFDTDKATIDKDGKLTAWSDEGEIYYYVKYKVGSAQYLEVHEMHAQSRAVEIKFDESDLTMEMDMNPDAEPNRKYLRLRFYPSDAECDLRDPARFRWEIPENGEEDNPVIDFVYFYYDEESGEVGDEIKWDEVERDDDGNLILPEGIGVTYGGDIVACSEGTAKVKVSYLGEADEEGNQTDIATATCTVKVVKPIIWEDMEEQIDAMNSRLYAVTDLDTKLSDVKLDNGWAWEDPDTSLANFKGMDGCQFPAVYTDENDPTKTLNASLWVRFVTVTGIEIESKNKDKQEGGDEPDWFDWVPDSIGKGESVTLRYSYRMENLNEENAEECNAVKAKLESNYQIEWTSNPANAGTAVSDGTYRFTAPQLTKAQKYTFTVSVKGKKTNKVYLKNSCAITVTVNSLYDWDKKPLSFYTDFDAGKMWLRCIIWSTESDYNEQPLTIVSEDPAILKLKGKMLVDEETDENGTHICLSFECENPKPGTAWIKVTAADEIKSSRRFCLEFIDKEPKLIESAVTINQALDDKSAEVTVRTHMQYPIDSSRAFTLQLDGKDTTDITAIVLSTALIGDGKDTKNSYYDYSIKLALAGNATSVKKGKHKVTLNLTVNTVNDEGTKVDSETCSLNLTVNVINTVPKVTFKQAKKVNLFYTDEEGYGILNVNVTGTDIKELKLDNCDFEVKQDVKSGEYRIAPKANVSGSSKKGKLSYKLEGCSGNFETNFTVATETKKPTIVLSQKSDTLYPMAGYETSWLWMTDKATGEGIVPSEVMYVENKKPKPVDHSKNPEISGDEINWDIDPDKNSQWKEIPGIADYKMIATKEGGIVFRLLNKKEYKKKTDKFSLKIQEDNWADAIPVSYSIKVDTAKPKLALGKSTLTLNKNNAVYRAQQERTSLHLKGTSDAVYQGNGNWVRFDGQDEKSKKILRADNSLVLQYREDQGDVIVRFNDNKMEKGTYKFKVSVGNEWVGLVASTVLTVKIVDVSIEKTLKVTAKGSIDVMNREGTSIAYTPKISNISGKVYNGRLEGMDSDLFDYDWDGSKLIVKARYGTTYNTKHTYRVRAIFEVETEDYDNLTVSTDTVKPLTIKVKQGKPKLTASTVGNTIYRQLDSTVDIKLSAMLNKQEVEIDDVWLLNFTEDFELKTTPAYWRDENGTEHPYDAVYNPQTKSVRLGLQSRYEAVDAIKSGKTCKVKLAVRYRDQAGNEKVAQVTCSIVVR